MDVEVLVEGSVTFAVTNGTGTDVRCGFGDGTPYLTVPLVAGAATIVHDYDGAPGYYLAQLFEAPTNERNSVRVDVGRANDVHLTKDTVTHHARRKASHHDGDKG